MKYYASNFSARNSQPDALLPRKVVSFDRKTGALLFLTTVPNWPPTKIQICTYFASYLDENIVTQLVGIVPMRTISNTISLGLFLTICICHEVFAEFTCNLIRVQFNPNEATFGLIFVQPHRFVGDTTKPIEIKISIDKMKFHSVFDGLRCRPVGTKFSFGYKFRITNKERTIFRQLPAEEKLIL